ncbi:DUF2235 domain-containing protein [Dyella sp. 333MFSha]|uniref:phospholipase effector Tle1 domain-containing protein n=1 Tax=Dyella sp. 333MFSha TaxID=1798240 RepID=UPI00088C3A1B|nr:DUF2235 domain-containing protein [Dyella sp. 333MFSha]SDG54090.1 Uncharacterized alpha/beta hydrolase domain [Dyella sp. 333MFSha]
MTDRKAIVSTKVRIAADGIGDDGVGHTCLTDAQLDPYAVAIGALSHFDVPILVRAGHPHERLFVVMFDVTQREKTSVVDRPQNVCKISDDIRARVQLGNDEVRGVYVTGPGVPEGWFAPFTDRYRKKIFEQGIHRAYDDLIVTANRWRRDDPDAAIRVHSIGFSRGASQAAVFARLLHERGIPYLDSEVRSARGSVRYERYITEPGQTIQTVGLFDPVATGVPMLFDRRLPPSVVSGLQLTAVHERRIAFRSDQILPPGLSEDGRFLHLMLPGTHADVGGGYWRDGLSIRAGNIMRNYSNALCERPYLTLDFEPMDQRLNVIHQSHEHTTISRLDPRVAERGTPSGTNTVLVPKKADR